MGMRANRGENVWRKPLVVLLGMTFLTGMFAACGRTSTTTDNQLVPNDTSTDEVTTITFMYHWPESANPPQYKVVNQIIDSYVAQHPHVTIKQEVLEIEQYKNKLMVLAGTNSLPDVGITYPAGFLEPYVKSKRFAKLDDLLQGKLNGKFVAGTTDAFTFDDHTYSLPLELNIVPVYYNKAIFAKYDLQPPETYVEFRQLIHQLINHNVVPIALGNRERWTGSMWYMYLADRIGGHETLKAAITRKGTFQHPALVAAAKEIVSLVEMDAFYPGFNGLTNEEAKVAFMTGKAAMYMMGTWELPNYITNPNVSQEIKDKIGFFKFPMVQGGKGDNDSWVGGAGVGLFVSEDSKVKEEAKRFVQYFVQQWGELSVSGAGVIPATKVDIRNVNLPPLYMDLLSELNNASNLTLFADVQLKQQTAEVHLNMIQALYGKAVTPEQFAKAHDDALALEP